jgi:hypothetical protein
MVMPMTIATNSMKGPGVRTWPKAIMAGAAILAPTSLIAPAAASAAPPAPSCTAAAIEAWASNEGNGTAGTTFYALELSNISSKTCTLHGFPSVWGISKTGARVGKPASHRGTPTTVILSAGATAHVVLGVIDVGALCGSGVAAAGLKVVPPGQAAPASGRDEIDNFSLRVCPNASSMNVDSVHAGAGLPLYTTS